MLTPPWRVSQLLVFFVVALALPLFTLIAWRGSQVTQEQRHEVRLRAIDIATEISIDLDEKIVGYITLLKVLASSNSFLSDELETIYEHVQTALQPVGISASLSDPMGDSYSIPRRRFWSSLPRLSGINPSLFVNGEVYLSDLVKDETTKRFVVYVSVPIFQNGAVDLCFISGVSPAQFKKLIDRQSLPSHWAMSIFHRNGVNDWMLVHDGFRG